MAAIPAVNFIINDHCPDDRCSGFRKTFAEDTPYKSLLQRNGVSLEDLLSIFDWDPDNSAWVSEYSKPNPENHKLIKFRRRLCFSATGWRDVKEDFGRGDVSCLRDIRVPLVTSKSPLRSARDEFYG